MAHLWVRIRRYGRLAKRLTDDAQFDCLYEYYLHKQIAGQKPPPRNLWSFDRKSEVQLNLGRTR